MLIKENTSTSLKKIHLTFRFKKIENLYSTCSHHSLTNTACPAYPLPFSAYIILRPHFPHPLPPTLTHSSIHIYTILSLGTQKVCSYLLIIIPLSSTASTKNDLKVQNSQFYLSNPSLFAGSGSVISDPGSSGSMRILIRNRHTGNNNIKWETKKSCF